MLNIFESMIKSHGTNLFKCNRQGQWGVLNSSTLAINMGQKVICEASVTCVMFRGYKHVLNPIDCLLQQDSDRITGFDVKWCLWKFTANAIPFHTIVFTNTCGQSTFRSIYLPVSPFV